MAVRMQTEREILIRDALISVRERFRLMILEAEGKVGAGWDWARGQAFAGFEEVDRALSKPQDGGN